MATKAKSEPAVSAEEVAESPAVREALLMLDEDCTVPRAVTVELEDYARKLSEISVPASYSVAKAGSKVHTAVSTALAVRTRLPMLYVKLNRILVKLSTVEEAVFVACLKIPEVAAATVQWRRDALVARAMQQVHAKQRRVKLCLSQCEELRAGFDAVVTAVDTMTRAHYAVKGQDE